MATLIIPTRTDLRHYSERVELDGDTYELTLQWNERGGHWWLSIKTGDGTEIASGLKVVVNWPLLARVSSEDKPAGDLVALDTSGAGLDPGADELGERVLLLYSEAS